MWLMIVELLLAFAGIMGACRFFLHMLQLESYQLDGYVRYLKKNYKKVILNWTLWLGIFELLAGFVLRILLSITVSGSRDAALVPTHIIMWAVFALYGGWSIFCDYKTTQKKKLVFTKRMKRLTAGLAGVTLIIELICMLLFKTQSNSKMYYMYISPLALIAFAPAYVWLAGRVMEPVENSINRKFYVAAEEKLRGMKDVVKIGITGSYGKTSTKHALATILSVKFRVLKSPASINTPMGLSALINNKFPADTQVFIAEMGARHTGDIKELVDLIHPTYGIITSVGPQHLETFGTVDKIANTKYDLIRGLPKSGKAFFASDNDWVDRMYRKSKGMNRFLSGYELEGREINPECCMLARNLSYGPDGLSFELVYRQEGADVESVECTSRLLGIHNLSNIVLCCSVAKEMGLTMEEISRGVSMLEPVEHRLQVINGPMTVIDDAFNSNPTGAKEALNVLSSFPGRHIIVTPGFVEMGGDEDKFNFELGRQIARKCDIAILVGLKHTAPIRRGILEEGFEESMVYSVKDLDAASALLRKVGVPGDSVLFENDLPDNYNE